MVAVSVIAPITPRGFAQTYAPTAQIKQSLHVAANFNLQTNQTKTKDAKPELVLQTGYNSFYGPTRLVFSPDGRLLATTTFRSNTVKLWETATGRELRNLSSAGQNVPSMAPVVAFSADGRLLAVAAGNNSVKVWEVNSGRELQTLTGGQSSLASSFGVSFIGFSGDGKRLVAVSDAIRVWDTSSWQELKTIDSTSLNASSATGGEGAIALSSDGNQLARVDTGGAKAQLRVFDLTTGKEGRSFNLPDDQIEIVEISFTPDGRLLAAANSGKKMKLWDVTGKGERDLAAITGNISLIKFSRDGRFVALSEGYTVRTWETGTGRELPALNVPNNGVFVESGGVFTGFSHDGKKTATGGFGLKPLLWDTETGKQIQEMTGRSNAAYAVAFSADGTQLTAGGRTRWDLRTGRGLRLVPSPSEKLFSMPSPDGKLIATFAPNSNSIAILETPTGRARQTLSGPAGVGVERARFSADGNLLAASFMQTQGARTVASLTSNQLKIWETASGREVRTIDIGMSASDFGFSDNGRVLITLQAQGEVALWDVASGSKLRNLTPSAMPNLGSMTNPSTASMPSMPNMADLNSMVNNVLGSMSAGTMGRTVTSYGFSADGKTVATGGLESKSNLDLNAMMNASMNQKPPKGKKRPDDPSDLMKNIKIETNGQVVLWDMTTGSEVGRISGHGKSVTGLAFSRDGKLIASGSTDNTIKIWDVATKRELRTLTGHTASVESMDFSPDGQLLASAGEDGGVFLWDLRTGEHLLTLVSLDDGGEWIVVTPEGLFDGTPASWNQVLWRYNRDTFNVAPIEWFFNEFYHPGLLADVFAGKRPRVTKDVSTKDRRQPIVKLSVPGSADAISTRTVKARLDIADAPADADHPQGSGARDVRLFRNGSLVKVWHGDALKGQSAISLEADITIGAGPNVLTAYAFNNDNIKSRDATLMLTGAESLKRAGSLYLLGIGVNNYSNQNYNLKYAVADAQDFSAEVKRQQGLLKRYAQVEVALLSDTEATKANITQKLAELAKRVQPEDAVIVFFAGHGTAQGNQFYLIPHDLGYDGPRDKLNEAGLQTILSQSISDRELEKLFETVDAGQLLLVIDACNSGQALEAEEKRRGPMNSKGLAQLAYEKGMYVMTAAQSYQAAQEASKLGHGFLTYALVEAGLKQGAADREPKNGTIDLREWLNFATDEVPRMQEESTLDAIRGRSRYVSFVGDGTQTRSATSTDGKDNVQRPRVFYRRELESNPLVVAIAGGTSPP